MKYKQVYYTIGQVSNISELPQSVLRYWESVIEALNPKKSEGGTRQYSESDIELILLIKKLLYDDGFTIKGANRHITEHFVNEIKETKSEDKENSTLPDEGEKKFDHIAKSNIVSEPGSRTHPIDTSTVIEHVITELKSILRTLNQ